MATPKEFGAGSSNSHRRAKRLAQGLPAGRAGVSPVRRGRSVNDQIDEDPPPASVASGIMAKQFSDFTPADWTAGLGPGWDALSEWGPLTFDSSSNPEIISWHHDAGTYAISAQVTAFPPAGTTLDVSLSAHAADPALADTPTGYLVTLTPSGTSAVLSLAGFFTSADDNGTAGTGEVVLVFSCSDPAHNSDLTISKLILTIVRIA